MGLIKFSFGRKRIIDKKKRLKFLLIFFILFSIVWIGSSVFTYFYITNFINNGTKTEAVINSIKIEGHGEDTDYDVLVEYRVNGKVYYSYLNAYNSNMKVGKTIPIWYLTNNPGKIIYGNNVYIFSWLSLIIGLGASIASIVTFTIFKKEKVKENLQLE